MQLPKFLLRPSPKQFQFLQWDAAHLPKFASIQYDQLTKDIETLGNHLIQMSKWLVGSLMLLNSGSVAALLNSGAHVYHPSRPAWAFISGILLALLNGWLVQLTSARAIPWIHEARHYWAIVTTSGAQTEASERWIWDQVIAHRRWAIWVPLPAWLSAGAFLTGAILVALNFH